MLYLKPAAKGTTIIAGSSVRTILELVGVKNILTKIIGSSNKINNAKATILALQQIKQTNIKKHEDNEKDKSKINKSE